MDVILLLCWHPNFMSTNRGLTPVEHSVLKVSRHYQPGVQEKALVGVFSMIVSFSVRKGSFAALVTTMLTTTTCLHLTLNGARLGRGN